MMKKGEMSMNMIIMAVIAIIMLVIIVFLITGSGGDVKDATSCPSKGGICTDNYCAEEINNGDGCENPKRCCNPMSVIKTQ